MKNLSILSNLPHFYYTTLFRIADCVQFCVRACVGAGAESVIVIGANKVRPFTGRDLVMMKRVALVLARALDLH